MENIEFLKKQISMMMNLFNARKFDQIINKGTVLLKKFPDQAILYNITALAYNAVGKAAEARKILIKILREEPENISVLNNLGLACEELSDDDQAEEYYNKALKLKSNFPDVLVNLGNLKMKQNKEEEAKNFFIKALKINNQIIPAKISLAAYYEQSGNFEEAKKIYKEVLVINPNFTVADKSLSLIHKYKLDDEHIKIMEKKLTEDIDKDGARRLNFALGKAYEDIGHYKKSFKFYEHGNKLFRKQINYDINDEIKSFTKIKKIFISNNVESLNDYGQKIIFIVGMPRSGTTLAEQILSSHKKVYGAGELNFLRVAIEKKLMTNDGEFILNSESLKEVKNYYLENIKNFKNKEEYLVDKAPLNFKWVGFIKAIFPNSKIIHCTRSPMDICWSNFKNTFASKSMNYTYDFNDLAAFYKLYDDLMKFWNKRYDKNIFNLIYEDLVKNKELETKKLLKFCELDWDDNCLDFHKNKKLVSTASLAQVRQPLYSSSVKKWKNYSEELNVLKEKLIN
jgi:tetratricopeptide (TPR) repeat protein